MVLLYKTFNIGLYVTSFQTSILPEIKWTSLIMLFVFAKLGTFK